jgi:hypothetical protein
MKILFMSPPNNSHVVEIWSPTKSNELRKICLDANYTDKSIPDHPTEYFSCKYTSFAKAIFATMRLRQKFQELEWEIP